MKIKEQVSKVQEHIKDYAVVYISGAVLAGFTLVIMRERHAGLIDRTQRGLQDHRVHGFSSFNFLTKDSGNITSIVNVVEREGRGHPGYIIRCKETLEEFPSQKIAAISEGVNEMIMSDHIRKKLPDINDKHFERVAA